MPKFRVGTRGSLLALTQTRMFTEQLLAAHPDLELEEVTIQTKGDVSTEPLNQATTPGLFVSALREAMLDGRVDFIVHSMKDLPAAPHSGIVTACVPVREDPRDGLVSRENIALADLPSGAVIGTSSPRRAASIRRARPDLTITDIRGNVDTRIAKVQRGEVDATLLALAGLNRIGRTEAACEVLSGELFVPAAGQGALSVECREDDADVRALLAVLDDPYTRLTTTAERTVLLGLDAGCATAIGAFANYEDGVLRLNAELAVAETGEAELVTVESQLQLTDLDDAATLGMNAAKRLLKSSVAARAAWK